MNLNGWSPRTMHWLFACLFLLSTTRMLGHLTGIEQFSKIGKTIGFAPNPNPFLSLRSEIEGTESALELNCTSSAQKMKFLWNRKGRHSLGGPERRLSYFSGIFSAVSTERGRNTGLRLLVRETCQQDGALFRVMNCIHPVEKVGVVIPFDTRNPGQVMRDFEIPCSELTSGGIH